MQRFSFALLLYAVLGAVHSAQAGCPSGGCTANGSCGATVGCGPYWCDPYVDLRPWPNNNCLYSGPRNWAWIYPHGGFTAYPGQPGSGVKAVSDHSQVNWLVPPATTAQLVKDKLQALGIPAVPQETIYLDKNPAAADKAKMPLPKSWIKDVEPEEGKNN